ncbi:hypothetical protein Plhal703r1_c15g0073261 [Plasmopara halstedii]
MRVCLLLTALVCFSANFTLLWGGNRNLRASTDSVEVMPTHTLTTINAEKEKIDERGSEVTGFKWGKTGCQEIPSSSQFSFLLPHSEMSMYIKCTSASSANGKVTAEEAQKLEQEWSAGCVQQRIVLRLEFLIFL